ncbi:signal peptidase I [Pseudoflavonifractor phocaeensis]|uniref:signal peptidase I n=1 Tax=Pseudoflavonifractor phocaeensis TaxID=1870988 RepID=UPI0019580BB2|nr:signal peptidase I [Pseudoflavonifractor phocaeensis]MBM6925603.1 signal peptidase I [Pseudoflavonifractor phocaeensis]
MELIILAKEQELSGRDALKVDLYFWLQALVMVLVALILIFTFIGRIIGVDGSSMYPTLHHGDMLLLQSIGYTPKQGDVVVLTKEFDAADGPIVKRVIAVGGQHVDIDYAAGTVSVDGQVLNEPYINEAMREPYYENLTSVDVPEGSIFVMGDNRNNSSDSRDVTLGTVDERYVLGRALWVILPFQDFGGITHGVTTN